MVVGVVVELVVGGVEGVNGCCLLGRGTVHSGLVSLLHVMVAPMQ